MSTTSTQEGLQNTRQLLDELDVLLEQMLTVPVDDRDEATSSNLPSDKPLTVSATLTMLEMSAPASTSDGEQSSAYVTDAPVQSLPAASDAVVSAASDHADDETSPRVVPSALGSSSAATAEVATTKVAIAEVATAAAATVAVPVMADVAAPPIVELVSLPAHVPARPWSPSHVAYRSLLWINHRFDEGAAWLGKPGRFFKSRLGKQVAGVCGLALLGLAAAWLFVDWLGWNW